MVKIIHTLAARCRIVDRNKTSDYVQRKYSTITPKVSKEQEQGEQEGCGGRGGGGGGGGEEEQEGQVRDLHQLQQGGHEQHRDRLSQWALAKAQNVQLSLSCFLSFFLTFFLSTVR